MLYCVAIESIYFKSVMLCTTSYSSRFVRPCEPTSVRSLSFVNKACNSFKVLSYYFVMFGCVLRVCDPSSCVLWCVAVEVLKYIFMLCVISHRSIL